MIHEFLKLQNIYLHIQNTTACHCQSLLKRWCASLLLKKSHTPRPKRCQRRMYRVYYVCTNKFNGRCSGNGQISLFLYNVCLYYLKDYHRLRVSFTMWNELSPIIFLMQRKIYMRRVVCDALHQPLECKLLNSGAWRRI